MNNCFRIVLQRKLPLWPRTLERHVASSLNASGVKYQPLQSQLGRDHLERRPYSLKLFQNCLVHWVLQPQTACYECMASPRNTTMQQVRTSSGYAAIKPSSRASVFTTLHAYACRYYMGMFTLQVRLRTGQQSQWRAVLSHTTL